MIILIPINWQNSHSEVKQTIKYYTTRLPALFKFAVSNTVEPSETPIFNLNQLNKYCDCVAHYGKLGVTFGMNPRLAIIGFLNPGEN